MINMYPHNVSHSEYSVSASDEQCELVKVLENATNQKEMARLCWAQKSNDSMSRLGLLSILPQEIWKIQCLLTITRLSSTHLLFASHENVTSLFLS